MKNLGVKKWILILFSLITLNGTAYANTIYGDSDARTCRGDHFDVCKISVMDSRVVLLGSCSLNMDNGFPTKRIFKEIQSVSCDTYMQPVCPNGECSIASATGYDCRYTYLSVRDFAQAISGQNTAQCGKLLLDRRMEVQINKDGL